MKVGVFRYLIQILLISDICSLFISKLCITLTTWYLVKHELLHPIVNIVWHVPWNCIIVANLLDYYLIILICNMADATCGSGHAYPSGASNFMGVHIVRTLVFWCVCDVIFSLFSDFVCNLLNSVCYIVYLGRLCFICSRLGYVFGLRRIWIMPHLTLQYFLSTFRP